MVSLPFWIKKMIQFFHRKGKGSTVNLNILAADVLINTLMLIEWTIFHYHQKEEMIPNRWVLNLQVSYERKLISCPPTITKKIQDNVTEKYIYYWALLRKDIYTHLYISGHKWSTTHRVLKSHRSKMSIMHIYINIYIYVNIYVCIYIYYIYYIIYYMYYLHNWTIT